MNCCLSRLLAGSWFHLYQLLLLIIWPSYYFEELVFSDKF
jgi:hypothetical protein